MMKKIKGFRLVIVAIIGLMLASKGAISGPLEGLRTGDVLLIELNCYSCDAISRATQSRYHHSGLVIQSDSNGVLIAQSLTRVETMSLESFLRQAKKKSVVAHLRAKELDLDLVHDQETFQYKTEAMVTGFYGQFLGLPFDVEYLWDNVNEFGEELLYCSEMIQKTLNLGLQTKLKTIPMDFRSAYDFWYQYFRGKVPQDKEGNSPASLYRADEMKLMEEGPLENWTSRD